MKPYLLPAAVPAWLLSVALLLSCTASAQTITEGFTFSVASDADTSFGTHFHSNTGGDFGNPAGLAEVGRLNAEEIRGLSEYDIADLEPVDTAFVTFEVHSLAGLFNQGPFTGTIQIVAYLGNNQENLSDYSEPALATIGSFSTSGLTLGDTLSFPVATALNAALDSEADSLGIRLAAVPLNDAGALTFANFRLTATTECTTPGGCGDPSLPEYCTQATPPLLNYRFSTIGGSPSSEGGVVSRDGRVLMLALPDDADEDDAYELAVFNPFTDELTWLTSGTQALIDPLNGQRSPITHHINGLARQANLVALSGSGRLSYPFLLLPGETTPRQVEEVSGFPAPVRLFDIDTGTSQTIGTLANVPLEADQYYIAEVRGLTADGSRAWLTETIVTATPVEIGGRTRLLLPGSGGVLQSSSGLVDVASGELVADIDALLTAAAGGPYEDNARIMGLSGNGNAVFFASAWDLSQPSRPLWEDLSRAAGGALIYSVPYVYFLDQDQLIPVVQPDLSQPRLDGTSAFIFLRNIGLTGTVFGIDRGMSYLGSPPNLSGANNPATVTLGNTPQYVTPPSATPPARGFFANNFAKIAPEEDRVYFQHTDDLVPGRNPRNSQELFSIEVGSRRIRQISNLDDDLSVRFADEPDLLFQYGGNNQVVYAGSSGDHRVVAFTQNQPGGFNRTVTEVDENGRVTVRQARFGTAEYPASKVYRIVTCLPQPGAAQTEDAP